MTNINRLQDALVWSHPTKADLALKETTSLHKNAMILPLLP